MEFAAGVVKQEVRRRAIRQISVHKRLWCGATGEYIVGDERGVWRTRTVTRKPARERWSRGNLKRIAGVPRKLTLEGGEADGEDMKTEVEIMDKEYKECMAKG